MMGIIQINTLLFALCQLVCIVTSSYQSDYQIVDSSKVTNIFKSLKSRTLTHCLLTCGKTTLCVLINYNKSTKECQLCSEFKNQFNVESDEKWSYIQMILEEETVLSAIQTTEAPSVIEEHLNSTAISNTSYTNVNFTEHTETIINKSNNRNNNSSIHFLGLAENYFVYERPINATELTLCFWFKAEGDITREQALISLPLQYQTPSQPYGCNNFFLTLKNYTLRIRGKSFSKNTIYENILYNQSYHFCFTMDPLGYNFYINTANQAFVKKMRTNASPYKSDLIVLGTEMDPKDDICLPDIKVSGHYYQGFLMDVNFWDRALGEEVIQCVYIGCDVAIPATIPWSYFLQFPIENELIKLSSVDLSSKEN